MKKILAIGLVFLLALVGCNNETQSIENQEAETQVEVSENSQTLQKIKNSGQLIMGTNANYPPFEFHKVVDGEDKILGFDISIANEIADELGVELVIEDMDFSAVLQGVQSGIIDVGIAGINNTPERLEVMDFSDVYYESIYTVLVLDEDLGKYNTPEKMSEAGITVGVQTATVQENIANEIENINIVSLAKTPDLVLQLKSGLIDAILTENTVADLYELENEELASDPDGDFEGESGASIAVKKGDQELLEVINKVINNLKEEGKIDQFYEEALMEATGE